MVKNKYFILIVLSLAFALVRLPVILTSMERIFDMNELYAGTIAKEWIEGPSLPFFDYQLTPMKGGTLLAGVFLVPFFLLFGQSYFVVKFAALSVSLMILAVTYLFLWKYFNKRIAVITGFLMVLPAPLYTLFSVTHYGREYDSILFTMTALFFFYGLFFQDTPPGNSSHSKLYLALWGLVCGLGMYCSYIFAITLICCLIFWFLFDKAFFLRKDFGLFFLFFLVGLTPWIYYNLTHGFAAICVDDDYAHVPLRRLFFSHSFPETLHRLDDLLFYLLPHSFYFRDFKQVSGDLISYGYYMISLISFSVLFWRNRNVLGESLSGMIPWGRKHLLQGSRYREAFILLYLISFPLLYSFSCHTVSKRSVYNFFGYFEYRFLIILYPFFFIAIALFLNRLWDWGRSGKRIASYLLAGLSLFLVTTGFIAHEDLVTPRNLGRHFKYDGYNYDILGIVIGERYGQPLAKDVDIAEKVREPYKPAVFRGIGWNRGWRFFRGQEYADMAACMNQIDNIDDRYRPFILEGFGAYLELQLQGNITGTLSYVNSIPEAYRPYVCRGIGWFIGWRFKDDFYRSIQKISKISKAYRPDCYRGLGQIMSMICGRNKSRFYELLEKVDPKYQPYLLEGGQMISQESL